MDFTEVKDLKDKPNGGTIRRKESRCYNLGVGRACGPVRRAGSEATTVKEMTIQ